MAYNDAEWKFLAGYGGAILDLKVIGYNTEGAPLGCRSQID